MKVASFQPWSVRTPPVHHRRAFIGYDNNRDALRKHCPVCHEGWSCPSAAKRFTEEAAGLAVWIPGELNPRRFPPIPRATQRFERLYWGRTVVDLVNARLKICSRADEETITEARQLPALVGSVLVVQ